MSIPFNPYGKYDASQGRGPSEKGKRDSAMLIGKRSSVGGSGKRAIENMHKSVKGMEKSGNVIQTNVNTEKNLVSISSVDSDDLSASVSNQNSNRQNSREVRVKTTIQFEDDESPSRALQRKSKQKRSTSPSKMHEVTNGGMILKQGEIIVPKPNGSPRKNMSYLKPPIKESRKRFISPEHDKELSLSATRTPKRDGKQDTEEIGDAVRIISHKHTDSQMTDMRKDGSNEMKDQKFEQKGISSFDQGVI